MDRIEVLKQFTTIVVDTGDVESIAQYHPRDATTNPSLLLKAAQDRRYRYLLDAAQRQAEEEGGGIDKIVDHLLIAFGSAILKLVPGRVSTEVDPRLSFDTEGTIAKAHRLIALYEQIGVDRKRVLIKIAATWEGIRAAERLEREGIHCNMTLLFSQAQAVACADVGVTLISPFVGRIYDWYLDTNMLSDIPIDEDPGVASVTRIYNYYKKFGYRTEVMGASFRKAEQIERLAGCDLLTVSPDMLEKFSAGAGEVTRHLSPEKAAAADLTKIELDEKEFRWQHNEDQMAEESLAEGIRRFNVDARQLERALASPAP